MKRLSPFGTILIILLVIAGTVSLAGGSGSPSAGYFPSHDLPPTLTALSGDAYLDATEQRVGRARGAGDGLVALSGPAWLLLLYPGTLLAASFIREVMPRRRPVRSRAFLKAWSLALPVWAYTVRDGRRTLVQEGPHC